MYVPLLPTWLHSQRICYQGNHKDAEWQYSDNNPEICCRGDDRYTAHRPIKTQPDGTQHNPGIHCINVVVVDCLSNTKQLLSK